MNWRREKKGVVVVVGWLVVVALQCKVLIITTQHNRNQHHALGMTYETLLEFSSIEIS